MFNKKIAAQFRWMILIYILDVTTTLRAVLCCALKIIQKQKCNKNAKSCMKVREIATNRFLKIKN